MSAGFVGRRFELALMDSLCARTSVESRPAAALISGLPGSGKTRLLAELRTRQRATLKLSITGYESAIQVPLAAAADLLPEPGTVSGPGETPSDVLIRSIATLDRSLE